MSKPLNHNRRRATLVVLLAALRVGAAHAAAGPTEDSL